MIGAFDGSGIGGRIGLDVSGAIPTDPIKRQSVWKLCAQELKREGGKAANEADEDRVLLWWY
jgi:hypothetical protein